MKWPDSDVTLPRDRGGMSGAFGPCKCVGPKAPDIPPRSRGKVASLSGHFDHTVNSQCSTSGKGIIKIFGSEFLTTSPLGALFTTDLERSRWVEGGEISPVDFSGTGARRDLS